MNSIVRSAFPSTRYQGSKRKLAPVIADHLLRHSFHSALDAFGGTGAIAYALKQAGKHVTYNDIMKFNHQIGLALIENDSVRLTEEDLAFVQERHGDLQYEDFIERTFDGIYFTREENRWLDIVCPNISRISCRYRRALAWFAVFQSAMIKRPYNLFHRGNLSMRLSKVQRTFGNKTTWDRPFAFYFDRFARQANHAVADSGGICRALCVDAAQLDPSFDLVYLDTPYIKRSGLGIDYQDFYHFLEGMVRYAEWPTLLDTRYKHLPLRKQAVHPWHNANQILQAFRKLLERFSSSIIGISYRSDGIPSIDQLHNLLKSVKQRVQVIELSTYRYVLSPNREAKEILLIGS